MSEKDYAPLSAACVRALHDKLYDKRKTAALEIEKYFFGSQPFSRHFTDFLQNGERIRCSK